MSIPKPGGKGDRLLGIPTVTDRLIQQALHQILSPNFEPAFSEPSFGFRPGRHARQAVQQARRYVSEGRSPLLPNILLDDLDRELERRGHCFAAMPMTARSTCGRSRAGNG